MRLSQCLGKLSGYSGRWKALTAFGLVLSAGAAVLGLLPYVFIHGAVSTILMGGGAEAVRYGWWALWAAIANIAIYIAALMSTHIAAFNTARNMRIMAMDHVRGLPLGFFTGNQSGRIRKLIDDGSSMTEDMLAHKLPDIAAAIVTPVAAIMLLFVFSPWMGLAVLLTMVLALVAMMSMMGGRNAGFYMRYQEQLGKMAAEAVEYVRAVPVLKTFNQTVWSFKAFHRTIKENGDAALGYALSCRKGQSAFLTIINSAFVMLIPMALILAGRGDPALVLVDFIFYTLFAPACGTFINKLMYSSEAVMKIHAAVEGIEEVMSIKSLEEGGRMPPDGHELKFSHVSFTYPGRDVKAVDDVSFTLKEGRLTALVGPSGGGKSTIAALAARFWDVDAGSITSAGVDLRALDHGALMEKTAIVFQDARLFQLSIKENVRAGRPGASDEEVRQALSKARCDDIIARLPNGVDTVFGSEGTWFSGGEVQRIALARAFLKDAPLVILDEATAYADAENEEKLQEAVKELVKGRTVLMVAHRLSTVVNADDIIVMDKGRAVEEGTFDALVSQGGLFSQMWSKWNEGASWKIKKEL